MAMSTGKHSQVWPYLSYVYIKYLSDMAMHLHYLYIIGMAMFSKTILRYGHVCQETMPGMALFNTCI